MPRPCKHKIQMLAQMQDDRDVLDKMVFMQTDHDRPTTPVAWQLASELLSSIG